ncbi:hypothetical protein BCR44DRAFT_57790 [Catenaria anguillulae PL171]|uniref:CCHC-type domain-containing protein n=1 Tax=Catenaria anguillulae PL171 TaxID=765915 RepID=A0A1Y2HB23_9FUNG|nr:hypothetical protein BCR44DRAFT_57790 [Catenaria anguillulae PL171]
MSTSIVSSSPLEALLCSFSCVVCAKARNATAFALASSILRQNTGLRLRLLPRCAQGCLELGIFRLKCGNFVNSTLTTPDLFEDWSLRRCTSPSTSYRGIRLARLHLGVVSLVSATLRFLFLLGALIRAPVIERLALHPEIDFGALLQLGHLPVYPSLGKVLQAASRAEARVQLASHAYKLVPEPDMLIFAKAIRSGRKPAVRVASFSLGSLVTFRVKVLTRRLPTLAQLHMYWPDRAPSPLCRLCGSLDDQQHWVVCARLADKRWELGVVAHKCVELLLPGADTTLAVQARSVLAHLLHPSRLRATAVTRTMTKPTDLPHKELRLTKHVLNDVVSLSARAQILAYLARLAPNPDVLVFAKAIQNGKKPSARAASFLLDSILTFQVKSLTGRLPTRARLHNALETIDPRAYKSSEEFVQGLQSVAAAIAHIDKNKGSDPLDPGTLASIENGLTAITAHGISQIFDKALFKLHPGERERESHWERLFGANAPAARPQYQHSSSAGLAPTCASSLSSSSRPPPNPQRVLSQQFKLDNFDARCWRCLTKHCKNKRPPGDRLCLLAEHKTTTCDNCGWTGHIPRLCDMPKNLAWSKVKRIVAEGGRVPGPSRASATDAPQRAAGRAPQDGRDRRGQPVGDAVAYLAGQSDFVELTPLAPE